MRECDGATQLVVNFKKMIIIMICIIFLVGFKAVNEKCNKKKHTISDAEFIFVQKYYDKFLQFYNALCFLSKNV